MIIKKKPSIHSFNNDTSSCELLILAAGFEDRAFEFISKTNFSTDAVCVFIGYKSNIDNNDYLYTKFKDEITKKFSLKNIHLVSIDPLNPRKFEYELKETLSNIMGFKGEVWLDISGLPAYAICSSLRISRFIYPSKEHVVIYTAAERYFPTYNEYEHLKNSLSDGVVDFLPPTMAQDMSGTLMLESFSGHRSQEGVSCLAVFAGYDVDRSAGVIENINPSILLLLYGVPGENGIQWRLDLSKDLHQRFQTTRKSAFEEISTLDPGESIKILEEYYSYIYEDYDFTISPVCSKMQAVGVYLFWEKYKEVQLVFPMPLGYSLDRKPQGVSSTYLTYINPKNNLFCDIEGNSHK